MKRTSLKFKYSVGICCLVLFVFLAMLLFMRLELDQRLHIELHKRGISIARSLAASAVKPILTENRITLQLLVNETLRDEEDIRYVFVVDRQGKVLAHTFGQGFPRELLKIDRPLVPSQKSLFQTIRTEDGQLEDVAVLIHEGDFGRVHIGLSEEGIKQELHEILLHGLPVVGLILFFGIAGAWWFAIKITMPLAQLSKSVKNVGAGNFDGEIHSTTNDEIGELSQAFNTMLHQLQRLREEQLKAHDDLRQQATMLQKEVTERQLAQEELSVKQVQLKSLNRLLEERVNTSVSELRLKDKVMLAQGRQAAMGEMINNIAHQWRQPLNNLGLIIQNLESEYNLGTLTSADMTDDINKSMKTILFMSQTINDFSNFFSIDKTRTTFSVIKGVKRVIAMMEASLSKQGIVVQLEMTDDITIEGYFNEYNQVVLNLLNNAKDILIERSVSTPLINISISRVDDHAVVKIRDNAGGIPDGIIEQIFDPYFTTKGPDKGSGVGLYMSKMIIEEHFDGSLTAVNVDNGAEFTISTRCKRAVYEFQ
jgi:signal transduction histidine kinase